MPACGGEASRRTACTVGSRSIATEPPRPSRSRGEQRGVTAGAERRVDHRLARLDREELAHLVREHGDVISRAPRKALGSTLGTSFRRPQSSALQVSRSQISEAIADARDDDVLAEAGVLEQPAPGSSTRPCPSSSPSLAPE